MKKGLKITLISIGAVVVGGGALVLAFGGIPIVRAADREFTLYTEHRFEPYPYADRGVPEDYETLTFEEWTISTPVKFECRYTGEGDSEGRKRIFYADTGEKFEPFVFFIQPSEMDEADLTGASEGDSQIMVRLREYFLNGYARRHGYEITDMFSFLDFLYHMDRAHPGISLRSGIGYYGFASFQNEMLESSDLTWEIHTEDFDGFIYRMDDEAGYKGYLDVCAKNDRSMTYSMLISASDEEMLINMINSVKLDPSKAEGD